MNPTTYQENIEFYLGHFSCFDALKCWQNLNVDEKNRAASFRFEKDQRAFAIVRSTLKKFLSEKIGLDLDHVVLEQSPLGKLSCSMFPNLHFSVAHTNDAFVLAFYAQGAVGVDIESVQRDMEMDKLISLVFSQGEKQQFESISDFHEQRAYLLATWTKKEALTKCLGRTLQQGMTGFEFMGDQALSIHERFMQKQMKVKTIELNNHVLSFAWEHSSHSTPNISLISLPLPIPCIA